MSEDTAAPDPAAADPGPEEGHRAGFVGIVGRPNAGKSTLMNRLLGEKIAIATPKPQTTRDVIRGVLTGDGWQIVFVDTPGIHEATSRLQRHMVTQAIGTMRDVDLVLVLVDAAKAVGRIDTTVEVLTPIAAALAEAGTAAFLVPNKIDRVKDKGLMLPLIQRLSNLHAFAEILPVSARTGDGVDELVRLIAARLPESPPLFPDDTLTDRSMRFLAAELIRERLFLALEREVPYHVAVVVDAWEEKGDGLVVIHASIHVARKGQKGIVIGKGGRQLRAIGEAARGELERFLQRRVYLDLHVRVEKDWVDHARSLDKLGYHEVPGLAPGGARRPDPKDD